MVLVVISSATRSWSGVCSVDPNARVIAQHKTADQKENPGRSTSSPIKLIIPQRTVNTNGRFKHLTALGVTIRGVAVGVRRERQRNDEYREIECESDNMDESDHENWTSEPTKDKVR